MQNNFLSLKGVTFSYDARLSKVLFIEDLELERGGTTVIVGPNGSGKTTLLKILSGLLKESGGELKLYGRAVTNGAREKLCRMSVFVHQNPYIFSGSVRHNIEYGLKLKRLPRNERNGIVAEVLNKVGLKGLEHRNALSLSGGEKQKLAMARAMAVEPDVLVLDEPDAHMDADSRRSIEGILQGLSAGGKTLIISTHNEAFAYRIADRIVRLEDGRLVSPSINILRGRLSGGDEHFSYFESSGTTILCPPVTGDFNSAVIPYEDIILSASGIDASTQNQLFGRVSNIEKESYLFLVTVDCGVPLRALVTKKSVEILEIREGKKLFVSFKASAVKLY